MRYCWFGLLLLFLLPNALYAQRQYSEGACILLLQQIDRFSEQKRSSNYRNAKREYDLYCQNPASAAQSVQTPRRSALPAEGALKSTADSPQHSSASNRQNSGAAHAATATVATDQSVAASAAETPTAGLEQQPAKKAAPEQVAAQQASSIATQKPIAAPASDQQHISSAQPDVTVPADISPADIVSYEHGPAHTVLNVSDAAMAETTEFDWTANMLLPLLNNLPLIIANIFALLLAVFLLTSWLGYNLPGFNGVFAEYKLNRLLRWRLSNHYQHFRKLALLTVKGERTVIDHLVLSPYGIFVIAVKTDRGHIDGSEAAANWSRHYFGQHKRLMNPLHQNFKNVEAVKALLQLQGSETAAYVHSIIAFSRVATLSSDTPANITYVDKVAAYLKQFATPVLTDEQLNRFSAVLSQASAEP